MLVVDPGSQTPTPTDQVHRNLAFFISAPLFRAQVRASRDAHNSTPGVCPSPALNGYCSFKPGCQSSWAILGIPCTNFNCALILTFTHANKPQNITVLGVS